MLDYRQQVEDVFTYASKEGVRITENIPSFNVVNSLLKELEGMAGLVCSAYWSGGWKADVVLNILLMKGETFSTYVWLLEKILAEGFVAGKTSDYDSRRTFPFRRGEDEVLGIRVIIDASKSLHCKQVKTGERVVGEYKLVCEDDTPPEVEPETLTDYLTREVEKGTIKEVKL